MPNLRIIKNNVVTGEMFIDSVKNAFAFVAKNYLYDSNIEFEFSTINSETLVENTVKINPNDRNRNSKQDKSSSSGNQSNERE